MGELDRFLRLNAFLAKTAGKRAVRAGLALYLTVGVAAVILFAGNGLDCRVVTRLASESLPARGALAGAWVTATLPVARALVGTKSILFLRALPLRDSWAVAFFAAALCVAHAPWFALWLRGAGIGPAIGATTTCMALQAGYVARRGSSFDTAGTVVAVGGWLVHPTWLLTPLAIAALVSALMRAWARLGEPEGAGRHSVFAGNRALAIGSALGVALVRGHGPVVVRALGFALLSCSICIVALTNGPVTEPPTIARIAKWVWVPACIFASASLAGPLLSIEDRLRWLFDLTATSVRVRRLAAAAVLGGPTSVAGAVFAVIVADARGLSTSDAAALVFELAAMGGAWASVTLAVGRRTVRSTGRDSGRLIVALASIYVASLGLFWLPRALGVVTLVAAGVALTLLAPRPPDFSTNFRRAEP